MINKIIDLRKRIENNLETISRDYDVVNDLLYQMSLIINCNVDQKTLNEWYYSNKNSIEIIEEIIDRNIKE